MSEDVFLDLVRKYQSLIYRHTLYLLNDQEDAKDATQETFIKAWEHSSKLRLDTVQSWLFKCANNLCIDLLRRRRFRAPPAKADDEDIETLMHDTAFRSANPSPEDLCVKRERQALVQRAIAQLPLQFRTVLVMRDIEDISFEEIAKTVSQPVGTVKSNVFRARKKLRRILRSLLG